MYLSRHTHSITGHSFGFGQISGYTEIMARSRKTPKLGRFYHTKPQQIYDDHDGPWSKSCQTIRKQWQRHSQTIIPKKGARKITKKQLIKLNKWMVMMTQHDSTPFQKITPKKETVLNSASKGSRKLKMDSQVLSWRVNRWEKTLQENVLFFSSVFFQQIYKCFMNIFPFNSVILNMLMNLIHQLIVVVFLQFIEIWPVILSLKSCRASASLRNTHAVKQVSQTYQSTLPFSSMIFIHSVLVFYNDPYSWLWVKDCDGILHG